MKLTRRVEWSIRIRSNICDHTEGVESSRLAISGTDHMSNGYYLRRKERGYARVGSGCMLLDPVYTRLNNFTKGGGTSR